MIRKFVATLLLIALPALPALAGKPDNPGKGNGKGKGNSSNSHGGGSSNGGSHGKGGSQGGGGGPSYDGGGHQDAPHFSSHDRDYWHEYWTRRVRARQLSARPREETQRLHAARSGQEALRDRPTAPGRLRGAAGARRCCCRASRPARPATTTG